MNKMRDITKINHRLIKLDDWLDKIAKYPFRQKQLIIKWLLHLRVDLLEEKKRLIASKKWYLYN